MLNAEQFTNVTAIFYEHKIPGVNTGGWTTESVELTLPQKVEGTNFIYYTTSYARMFNDAIGAHPFDLVATGPGVSVSNEFIDWNGFTSIM